MGLGRLGAVRHFVYPEEANVTILATIRKNDITDGALQKIAAARPDQISRATLRAALCSLR